MKQIRIADQPRLGLVRIIGITVDGIRYRLFRAAVTVAVIAVAVAFLMNILSESLIKRETARQTRVEIETRRLVHVWAARLLDPGAVEELVREVAAAVPGDAAHRETLTLSGLSPDDMDDLSQGCRKGVVYLDFFRDLDYARRRSLVYTASGADIFDRLRTEHGRKVFSDALNDLKSVHFVTPVDELTAYLEEWPRIRERIEQLRRGRQKAIEAVADARGETDILRALADESFGDVVRAAGFAFDRTTVQPEVARQARRILDSDIVEQGVTTPEARQIIARREDMLPADVTVGVLWELLLNRKNAVWYHSQLEEMGLPGATLSVDRIEKLAEDWRIEESLAGAERLTIDMGTGWLGLGRRMGWLLMVSMLVCGIGISNAMLMTVTERFREIATMKCLGALDGFIMVVFVLESCFLGLAGGLVGSLIGNLIGVGRMWAAFGRDVLQAIPVVDLTVGMISAVGVGIVLAAVAAVYPALKAARLAPMEAMRIE